MLEENNFRILDVKRALLAPPAPPSLPENVQAPNNCKVFVGGLPQSCAPTVVLNYFEQFGEVSKFLMPRQQIKDPSGTQLNQGFAYITFAESESAKSVLNAKHLVGGKWVGLLGYRRTRT